MSELSISKFLAIPPVEIDGHEDHVEHLVAHRSLGEVLALAVMRSDLAADEDAPESSERVTLRAAFPTDPYASPAPAPTRRCAA